MSLAPGEARHADASSKAVPADLIEVAVVAGSYGVQGWLKIRPEGPARESVLLSVRHWWLCKDSDRPQRVKANGVREHSGILIGQLESVVGRENALALRGARILISRADFPALPAGEYYWSDLIGCAVRNRIGDRLGTVQEIVDHGAHPILVIAPDGSPARVEDQILIPFVEPFLVDVDLTERTVHVDWELDS